ncbi:caspase family protein [Zoogloea sp.]|uniref:caspase family protein n=1 Tax=Zoogloea sp. TaxID=49181 RepID=UPI0035B478AF
MNLTSLHRTLILISPLLLGGCAASQMHGFQNAYQGYNIPEPLVEQVRVELKKAGLRNAQVTRDNVGRIRLTGSYQNEDEVDRAYLIVQSLVGLKSTSPFYPENIQEKRWEADAKRALAQFTNANRGKTSAPGVKRALIVGINKFRDPRLTDILGEDDARVVKQVAEKAGYRSITLLGPEATKANIENAIERMKRELGPNDSLLIYISSHGTQPVPRSDNRDARKMSIAAYDTGDTNGVRQDVSFAWKVHTTSVADTKVQELAQLPTKQTRVIIDTCYSGEILKDIPDESRRYILKTNGGMPERTGISMAAWSGDAYASKGIFASEDNPAQSATGGDRAHRRVAPQPAPEASRYTIITATSDGELSWGPNGEFDSPASPNKRLKGSFFTQAFFDYLDRYNGHIEPAFAAAKAFTYEKVSHIAPPSGWKGPVPIQQLPRLNPPLPANDPSTIYD